MIIGFMYYGKNMSSGARDRIIPVLDRRGQVHLGTWGAFDEAGRGFDVGLTIDYHRALKKSGLIWAPSPIYTLTHFGIKGSYTKHYHEPAAAVIHRIEGKGSRVYLVTDRDQELDEFIPLTYREVNEQNSCGSASEEALTGV